MTILRAPLTAVLALGLLAAPLATEAQQGTKIARIGFLTSDMAAGAHLREASSKDCVTLVTLRVADHGGNVSRAARTLGIHRSTLQRFMRKHNLSVA